MIPTPPITPWEADRLLRTHDSDERTVCGWTFYMDGPMLCPYEYMAPVATPPGGAISQWFCSGEPDDPVDEKTEWVLI